MLLDNHKKYHEMGPKDAGLKGEVKLQVARTTDHTGEQFAMDIPIYPDDSREQVRDRVNFFLSLIHDRVEDVNKAIVEMNEREQKLRHARELIKRNLQTFANKAKALEKRLKRKGKDGITQSEYEHALENLKAELKAANEPLQKELEAVGQKFEPPVPEAAPTEGLQVVQGE